MSEFKGTKGKWKITADNLTHDGGFIMIGTEKYNWIAETKGCHVGTTNEEALSNAKLIAAAPEMAIEIEETITDLKILKNQIINANKTNHLFDGMPELIEKWIQRKEQLINKATEL